MREPDVVIRHFTDRSTGEYMPTHVVVRRPPTGSPARTTEYCRFCGKGFEASTLSAGTFRTRRSVLLAVEMILWIGIAVLCVLVLTSDLKTSTVGLSNLALILVLGVVHNVRKSSGFKLQTGDDYVHELAVGKKATEA
ncbi:hypothetical protein GII33_18210 [Gordonia pseudamarae]|jgi:hypothetical protein|uniref:DUF983 domain-containing protein n=1 Tax=Gordonia pseudamarae TaxID=2831662 RepID=A0ABX6ILB4_9ACTN|nr:MULTISPECIES: hypothetical protein [Gordonia]MBD0021253.1 hypothetical protein [Gordonia sp. (in: high G+C Gram-positive bacteria)]QHN27615.1 hypothetical protein GII33_18210 [Gordonia pseudamarae]QHN36497.1 hypothetical protein GII31_17985 [Gordonia pseudamarae]